MEEILLFCKSKDFKYLKSRVIFSQKDIIIPYTKIKTYNTFSSTCLDNICTDFHKQFERIGITYEYSTKHLDIDSYNHIKLDWFNLQAHFIKSLNSDEILTLMGYTELSFSVVNSWCTNDDWWTILKEVIKGIRSSDYFPFFYQVLLVSQNFDFTKHHREIIDNFFNYKLDSQKYEHFMKIRHKMLGSMWKTFWNDVVSEYVDNLNVKIKFWFENNELIKNYEIYLIKYKTDLEQYDIDIEDYNEKYEEEKKDTSQKMCPLCRS
jgi:hypothetical protein